MQRIILLIIFTFVSNLLINSQEQVIKAIFSEALTSETAYENLRILCETTEGRLAGSPAAAAAVEFTRQIMEDMDLDTVYLQEMTVPNWRRGDPEIGRITSSISGVQDLNVISLGLSVGTGLPGLSAGVIAVQNLGQLEELGRRNLEGKIVFFNRPVDHSHYNTFESYSGAVDQRIHGPSRAAEYGAAATIVRSITTADHDFPHTGVTRLREDGNNIPAFAVSPYGADILEECLEADPNLKLYLRSTSNRLPDTVSYNVIGEIRGSLYPDRIITVGGHLDAWDNSQGAHDNGAGCMQSIEVLRIFRELGIVPKRTIRAVMFMDEEIAQSGGRKYAEEADRHNEIHYFAIESDRGAFTPTGFSIDAGVEKIAAIQALTPLFKPYGIHEIFEGFSGVDIAPMKNYMDVTLAGLVTDSQRYFDLHHSANDTFDKVNRREMQLGSAAMASLIFLLDHLDVLD